MSIKNNGVHRPCLCRTQTHERMRTKHYLCNKNTQSMKSRSALRTICIVHVGEQQFIKIRISRLTFKIYSMAMMNNNNFNNPIRRDKMKKWESRSRKEREKEFVQPSVKSSIEKQYPLSETSCSSDQTRFTHSRFLIPKTHSIRRLCAQNALVARGFLVRRLAPRELSAKRQYALRRRLPIHPGIRHHPPGYPREIQPSARPLWSATVCNFTVRFIFLSLFSLSFSANLTIFSFILGKKFARYSFSFDLTRSIADRNVLLSTDFRERFSKLLKRYQLFAYTVLWKTFLTVTLRHKTSK